MSTEITTTEIQSTEPMGGFALARYITEQAKPLAHLAELYVKGGLVPSAILRAQNPVGAAFTILTAGMELGLPPATALRTLHIIEGRASLSADLMAGLAMQAGASFEYIQNDAQVCKIRWTRGRSTGIVKFDVDDARAAGLLGKDNWKKYPAAMMAARAKAAAARQAAPDRLAGCYTPEDVYTNGSGGSTPSDYQIETPAGSSTPSPATGAGGESAVVDGKTTATPPVSSAVKAPEPARSAPHPGDAMKNSTRQRLMGLAKALGCTGSADVPQPNGSVRPSTTIVLDETLAQAIGRPGEPYVPLIELTNAQGEALIADLEARQVIEDATEALGGNR